MLLLPVKQWSLSATYQPPLTPCARVGCSWFAKPSHAQEVGRFALAKIHVRAEPFILQLIPAADPMGWNDLSVALASGVGEHLFATAAPLADAVAREPVIAVLPTALGSEQRLLRMPPPQALEPRMPSRCTPAP